MNEDFLKKSGGCWCDPLLVLLPGPVPLRSRQLGVSRYPGIHACRIHRPIRNLKRERFCERHLDSGVAQSDCARS